MQIILVIIPCGKAKVWDRDPKKGPTRAYQVYTGNYFKANKAYAEKFAHEWVILSAKYGFISPEFVIPENYDVSFKRPSKGAVSLGILWKQIREQELNRFEKIIGLGGKEYRSCIEKAFSRYGLDVYFPFAGLKLGPAISKTNEAVRSNKLFP